VLARIGDLLCEAVDQLQRIEDELRRAGRRIGRDLQPVRLVRSPLHARLRRRRSRKPSERRSALTGSASTGRRNGSSSAARSGRASGRNRRPFEHAFGHQGVNVRVEVERTPGRLDRRHHPGQRVRAGVEGSFVERSVTALEAAGVGAGFGLVLEVGVAHRLRPEQVHAISREVAAEDATILMYAFSPGRRGPLPRGIDRNEIEQACAGRKITDEEPFDVTGSPGFVRNARPRFYRLRRRSS
jgi:hypothetical protein